MQQLTTCWFVAVLAATSCLAKPVDDVSKEQAYQEVVVQMLYEALLELPYEAVVDKMKEVGGAAELYSNVTEIVAKLLVPENGTLTETYSEDQLRERELMRENIRFALDHPRFVDEITVDGIPREENERLYEDIAELLTLKLDDEMFSSDNATSGNRTLRAKDYNSTFFEPLEKLKNATIEKILTVDLSDYLSGCNMSAESRLNVAGILNTIRLITLEDILIDSYSRGSLSEDVVANALIDVAENMRQLVINDIISELEPICGKPAGSASGLPMRQKLSDGTAATTVPDATAATCNTSVPCVCPCSTIAGTDPNASPSACNTSVPCECPCSTVAGTASSTSPSPSSVSIQPRFLDDSHDNLTTVAATTVTAVSSTAGSTVGPSMRASDSDGEVSDVNDMNDRPVVRIRHVWFPKNKRERGALARKRKFFRDRHRKNKERSHGKGRDSGKKSEVEGKGLLMKIHNENKEDRRNKERQPSKNQDRNVESSRGEDRVYLKEPSRTGNTRQQTYQLPEGGPMTVKTLRPQESGLKGSPAYGQSSRPGKRVLPEGRPRYDARPPPGPKPSPPRLQQRARPSGNYASTDARLHMKRHILQAERSCKNMQLNGASLHPNSRSCPVASSLSGQRSYYYPPESR